jgi:apoptosis-inducing factor 2
MMADSTSEAATPQKKIVILGGSYGGISIAHNLLKHAIPCLPNKTSYQVIIVSPSTQAMCRPACPRALISDSMFPQDKLFVSIPEQFEQYPKQNFRFVHGTATQLDHANRTVSVNLSAGGTETLDFYALVTATGASTPSPLLGLNGSSDDLRSSWNEFRKALPTARSIVIAGGGPAGVETAGELGEHLNGRAGWFSSDPPDPKVKITVVTAGAQILPILRPVIAKKAEAELAKVGVTVVKKARVSSVSPDSAGTSTALTSPAAITLDNGTTLEADLYIPALGTTPNTTFLSGDLLTSDGRVDTNPTTLRVSTAGPRIYAIGDCASYSRPAIHLLLEAIPVLAANIKRDLLLDAGTPDTDDMTSDVGIPKERAYKEDKRETQLVPIGKSRGVGSAMGWSVPSWVVWVIKGRDYWLWTVGNLWSGRQWAKEQ